MKRAPPTRSQLLAMRRRLDRVDRGVDLLHRKREALVAELFKAARPAMDARATVDASARAAWAALLEALAVRGSDELEALGLPLRDVIVDLNTRKVWGVEIPDVAEPPTVVRSLALRDVVPASMGPAAERAAAAFEQLTEDLLRAAAREIALERLGAHLARATRQVNVLEQRLGPALRRDVARIRRVLEEREREDHLRLRRLRPVVR